MARKEDSGPSLAQKLGAEAIGTFMITTAAIGVDIFYYTQGNVDYSSRWLARGLVVAAVIYAFSETSGAHADPVVTIGFWLRRVFPLRMTIAYVVAQFAGAFAAAAVWLGLFGASTLALGASHPGPHFTPLVAAVAECVLTFVLMLVILMTAQEQPALGKQSALAVGFTVAVCGFAAGPISGASMNPARTLAAQILSGNVALNWVYVAGPLAGTVLAVAVHALLCGAPSKAQEKAARGKSKDD